MIRIVVVALWASLPMAAAAEAAVDGSDIRFLGYVASLVGAVVAILVFARSFVRSEIKDHEVAEEKQAEARHREIMHRIDNLVLRLADRGLLAHGVSDRWSMESK